MIEYPPTLPIPLLASYQLQDVDPLQRTQMDSGRTRNRRRWKNVPTEAQVEHLFSQQQFELFAGWWAHIIYDGALSYSAKMRTATGVGPRQVQPQDTYQSAWLGRHWRVSYPVRVLTRDLPSEQRTLELIYLDGQPMEPFVDRLRATLQNWPDA